MALSDYKLKASDYEGKRIADLSDRPTDDDIEGGDGLSADMLKAYFDYMPITVLGLTKLNGLIDYLTESGGGTIGIDGIDGLTQDGATVVETIENLLEMVEDNKDAIEAALANLAGTGRSGETVKQNADDISTVKGSGWSSETIKNNADQILAMKGTGWTVENLKTISDTLTAFINQKAAAGGLASLDSSGKLVQGFDASNIVSGVVPSWAIPDDAKERTVSVATEAAMLALTIDDVQDGDVVYVVQSSTGTSAWYHVIDSTQLGSYSAFRVMTSSVTSSETAMYYDPTATGDLAFATVFSQIDADIESVEDDIESLQQSKADVSSEVSATLYSSGWSSGGYTLSVSGVTASSNQEILPSLAITEAQLEALQYANIQDTGQSSGTLLLKSFGDVPTIDIPLRIIVRGD